MDPITTCPICRSKKITRVREDIQLATRTGKVTARNLDVDRCPNCGESFYDFEASKKIDAAIATAKRREFA